MQNDPKKIQANPEKSKARPVPFWWLALFNLTVLYAIGYFFWFHVLHKPGIEQQLTIDRKNQALLNSAKQELAAGLSPEELLTRLKDPHAISQGRDLYQLHCASCHGLRGEGTVGPNLTDRFWIHGGLPDQIISSVSYGVPSKGMVAWSNIIGPQKVEAVVAFVLSLQASNPPGAKAAEGDEY